MADASYAKLNLVAKMCDGHEQWPLPFGSSFSVFYLRKSLFHCAQNCISTDPADPPDQALSTDITITFCVVAERALLHSTWTIRTVAAIYS